MPALRGAAWAVVGLAAVVSSGASPAWAAKAKAAKAPTVALVDVTAVRDRLQVLTDGQGHYLAHLPFDADEHAYWGDGKIFYKIPVVGGGSEEGKRFDYVFWDPRYPRGVERSVDVVVGGAASATCGARTTPLTVVPEPQAKAMLAAARFHVPRWTRMPHALARDDRGTYYFVDRERREGGKDHQLWSGPRGRLKRLKMTNIVEDAAGEIYASRSGSLRLILARDEATWVVRRRETKLTIVPIDDSGPLVYGDLGVYTGKPIGTPCDDL